MQQQSENVRTLQTQANYRDITEESSFQDSIFKRLKIELSM